MKARSVLVALLLAGGILASCATPKPGPAVAASAETYTHVPYEPPQIVDTTVVDMPFEEAWNTLVKNLAVNYFAVDQIDKESRFISINASQDAGGIGRDKDWWLAYASCGTSTRSFSYKDRQHDFEYETLSTTPYSHVFVDGSNFWEDITPTVNAEIRMNIYLSPVDATRTEMSVNARYRFVRYLTGKRYSLRMSNEYLHAADIVDPEGSTITLTTRSPGRHPAAQTPPIMCYATGKFESAVIGLLQKDN